MPDPAQVLAIFDIDGTLVRSEGAGLRAMQETGAHLFGDAFSLEGVAVGGRLDRLIFEDGLQRSGREDPDRHHDLFRATYGTFLQRRLEEVPVSALPGAVGLLDALADVLTCTLGLITGNYPETGRMKLEAAGIDPARFAVATWGTDAADRRALAVAAGAAWLARPGKGHDPASITLVGDTTHDVDSARAAGYRSIAVTTGAHDASSLAEAGPDLLVEDLADTEALVRWITGP